ncbi:hypothetical protein BG006_007772, partial [Podila minutissima]
TIAGFPTLKTREYKAHKASIHTVGWNSDGRRLASGSVDKTARIWTPERTSDPRHSQELRGHTDSVDQLRWDPTHPDHLATASCDKTVRIWDARSGKSIHTIDTGGQNINISWSPDGQKIAVGNKDDKISFIDTRTFQIERNVQFKVEVNEIGWNPKGNLFFLTTGPGQIKVLEYPSMKEVHSMEAHTSNCYCLEVDPRGRYLATGSADALVNLWDMEEFYHVRSFGSLVETGESVHKITCFAAMNTVAWHPSKYLLAYAGDETDNVPGRSPIMAGNLRIFGFSP